MSTELTLEERYEVLEELYHGVALFEEPLILTKRDMRKINPRHGRRGYSYDAYIDHLCYWFMFVGRFVTWGGTDLNLIRDRHNVTCADRDKYMCLFDRKFLNTCILRALRFADIHAGPRRWSWAKELQFPVILIDYIGPTLEAIGRSDAVRLLRPWPRYLIDIAPAVWKVPMTPQLKKRWGINNTDPFYIRHRDLLYPKLWPFLSKQPKPPNEHETHEIVLRDQKVKDEVFKPFLIFVGEPRGTKWSSSRLKKIFLEERYRPLQGLYPNARIVYMMSRLTCQRSDAYVHQQYSAAELTMMKIIEHKIYEV